MPKKNSSKQILIKEFSKKQISKILNYWDEQQEKIKTNKRKQFTFFVLGFIVSYLLLSTLMYSFSNETKIFTGAISQGLLLTQGTQTTFVGVIEFERESAYSFVINSTNQLIVISWLCTGALEIIILISAMLASFGIKFKKKLVGIGAAIFGGLIFNFIRIWITLNIIMSQNAEVFELSHDILFRLTLLLYIIILYVVWFNWAEGKIKFKLRK
jgi:exosortase/archaeosortase family protein